MAVVEIYVEPQRPRQIARFRQDVAAAQPLESSTETFQATLRKALKINHHSYGTTTFSIRKGKALAVDSPLLARRSLAD